MISIILINILILMILNKPVFILINLELIILIFIVSIVNKGIINNSMLDIILTIFIISISTIETSILLAITTI